MKKFSKIIPEKKKKARRMTSRENQGLELLTISLTRGRLIANEAGSLAVTLRHNLPIEASGERNIYRPLYLIAALALTFSLTGYIFAFTDNKIFFIYKDESR